MTRPAVRRRHPLLALKGIVIAFMVALAPDGHVGAVDVCTFYSAGCLPGATKIDLTGRQLSGRVDATWFANVSTPAATRTIMMGKNRLTSVAPDAFKAFVNLAHLEMYTNSLTFVPQAVQNLTYLNWLDFGNNQITILPDHALDLLTRLTLLHIDTNSFPTVPDNFFDKLTQLTNLDLGNNPQLRSVPRNAFTRLTQITSVTMTFTDCPSLTCVAIKPPNLPSANYQVGTLPTCGTPMTSSLRTALSSYASRRRASSTARRGTSSTAGASRWPSSHRLSTARPATMKSTDRGTTARSQQRAKINQSTRQPSGSQASHHTESAMRTTAPSHMRRPQTTALKGGTPPSPSSVSFWSSITSLSSSTVFAIVAGVAVFLVIVVNTVFVTQRCMRGQRALVSTGSIRPPMVQLQGPRFTPASLPAADPYYIGHVAHGTVASVGVSAAYASPVPVMHTQYTQQDVIPVPSYRIESMTGLEANIKTNAKRLARMSVRNQERIGEDTTTSASDAE